MLEARHITFDVVMTLQDLGILPSSILIQPLRRLRLCFPFLSASCVVFVYPSTHPVLLSPLLRLFVYTRRLRQQFSRQFPPSTSTNSWQRLTKSRDNAERGLFRFDYIWLFSSVGCCKVVSTASWDMERLSAESRYHCFPHNFLQGEITANGLGGGLWVPAHNNRWELQ